MIINMKSPKVDTLSFAKALADETRQRILDVACCRWISVGQIVEALGGVSQPTVSHHLSVLRDAGLVETRREGKSVMYTVNQRALASACCTVAASFAPDEPVVRAEQASGS